MLQILTSGCQNRNTDQSQNMASGCGNENTDQSQTLESGCRNRNTQMNHKWLSQGAGVDRFSYLLRLNTPSK